MLEKVATGEHFEDFLLIVGQPSVPSPELGWPLVGWAAVSEHSGENGLIAVNTWPANCRKK